jgi:hypothetical protein
MRGLIGIKTLRITNRVYQVCRVLNWGLWDEVLLFAVERLYGLRFL